MTRTNSHKETWLQLHREPEYRQTLRPEIRDSWERCYDRGIDPFLRENPHICTESETALARKASHNLLEVSQSVMQDLLETVAGTGFVVALFDSNLCIIDLIGDREAMEWASQARFVVGSMWSEELIGTNGSLCAYLAKPFSVYAYEHFCLFSHVCASSGAPIFDKNKICGALCMVAPSDKVSRHTLGMVDIAAKHITSKLDMQRLNIYLKTVMESMGEGVLVLDSNGDITYMNDKCAQLLQIPPGFKLGSNISRILVNSADNNYFASKITQGRTIIDENFVLTTPDNNRLNCVVTCNPLSHPEIAPGDNVVIIRESKQVSRLVKKWVGDGAKFTFDDIIGEDPKFLHVLKSTRAASSSDSNVLLLGESGTGKDLFAQAMHNASDRRYHPYIAINCAALPRELIASELFGYEEGAFTGAKKGGNIGKFELADQGTIFLDEIGDMPLELQASLLRVLEEKKIVRIGGSKLIPVNVRIIAATNKDLENEVKRNRFRRDLYYRLGVIRITLPPLRERRNDILLLAEKFIEKHSKRLNKSPMKMTPEVTKAFLDYAWPGNIRELQNVIEGAILLGSGDLITYDLVADYLAEGDTSYQERNGRSKELIHPEMDSKQQMLMDYLLKYKYNKTKVAEALGISRRTLYKYLKDFDIS